MLCAAQAATAAAPNRQARAEGRGAAWIAVPAAFLAAGVMIADVVPGGPHLLALLATFGTPVLAGAGGFLRGSARRWLWPPAAAALWVEAWLGWGLAQDAAGLVLIAGACIAAASAAALVAPARALRTGLVGLAALDAVLVWGTGGVRQATNALQGTPLPHAAGTALPSLQQATFGSAVMGWLDLLAPALLGVVVAGRGRKLAAAAVTGLAAGAWGLLLLVTSEVAATVPVLAGLAFAAVPDACSRRLRHPLQPRGPRGGALGDRRREPG